MSPAPRTSIKAELVGRGTVTLRPSDHIATGGEGSVYQVSKDTVAKIYADPLKMAKLGLADKIRLLGKLRSPYIVAPSGLIISETREPIGYYMPRADGHPLSRVFTNDFWNREGFTQAHARELALRMRETVSYAHASGATLVDANELNWLVRFAGSDPEPRIVDVDSWSIGRYAATVIMPSIRDWHAKSFDHKSDWFSWGIVTFQVFTGLHPYKGTHPAFKRSELLERMKANASVFSKGVRLNQAVRDFAQVPKRLLEWYEAVFQKGERTLPPSSFDNAQMPQAALVQRIRATGKTGLLVLEKLFERTGDPVVRTFGCGAVLLSSGVLVDAYTKREIAAGVSRESSVVRLPDGWLIAEAKDRKLRIRYAGVSEQKAEDLEFNLEVRNLLTFGDRLFALSERGLTEIKLHIFGKKVIASAGQTWSVMPNATELFEGFGVQDAMGSMFLAVPTADQGLVQVRVRELDGLKVVTGKAGNRFVSLVTAGKTGAYQRIDIVFTRDYASYTASLTPVDQPELNMAILPKGVVVAVEEDGQLVITVPTTGAVTTVSDKHVTTDMVLSNFADQVVCIHRGAVWTIRMK